MIRVHIQSTVQCTQRIDTNMRLTYVEAVLIVFSDVHKSLRRRSWSLINIGGASQEFQINNTMVADSAQRRIVFLLESCVYTCTRLITFIDLD